jgi:tight adherence protein C
MKSLLTTSVWMVPLVIVYSAYLLLDRLSTHRRSRDRLFTEPPDWAQRLERDPMQGGWLRRWLFLAGYRNRSAPTVFVIAMLLATAFGIATVIAVRSVGLFDPLWRNIASLPAGVGDLLIPIAYLAPWTVPVLPVIVPWLVVRQTRRQRIEKVEQDLPISLELLATLSEAGLGFDAALARVLDAMAEDRPLAREFRVYQSDLLAGRTRVEALRRLAQRLDVSSVTIVVSALVQAEQLGSGIAQALRRQADDLRDRRREQANAFAMALPIKRLFPLVICFLPGIFVWTLGPFFAQLFQFAETFIRVRNF